MSGRFDQVPKEPDITTIYQRETRLGCLDVLYRRWIWDGIQGESLVFRDEDVGEWSDDEIIQRVRSAPICRPDSDVLLKRSASGYTVASFNFAAV